MGLQILKVYMVFWDTTFSRWSNGSVQQYYGPDSKVVKLWKVALLVVVLLVFEGLVVGCCVVGCVCCLLFMC